MSDTPPDTRQKRQVAYYEHQRSSNSASPSHYYPRGPSIQRPPKVYVNWPRPQPDGRYHPENAHAKTSVSSATSASSAASERKPHQPMQAYTMAPQTERGHVQHSSRKTSHMSPVQSYVHHNSNVAQSEMVEDHSAVIRYLQESEIDEDPPQEKDHAIWILFWLSFLDPFHSLLSCFFTIFALLGLIILVPFRLCQKDSSFSTLLIRTVAPLFRNHLQMIYAPSVKNAHTFDFSPTALVLVHIASPIVSLGIAFFSWIAAVFWLFAIIMGNPDGTEKRDDGRATVIGVRNWWEKYFLHAIRR